MKLCLNFKNALGSQITIHMSILKHKNQTRIKQEIEKHRSLSQLSTLNSQLIYGPKKKTLNKYETDSVIKFYNLWLTI